MVYGARQALRMSWLGANKLYSFWQMIPFREGSGEVDVLVF